MATKARHAPPYERLPGFLRALQEGAGLTRRALGKRLKKPQTWAYSRETGSRRVDVTEFIAWAIACGCAPADAFRRLLEMI